MEVVTSTELIAVGLATPAVEVIAVDLAVETVVAVVAAIAIAVGVGVAVSSVSHVLQKGISCCFHHKLNHSALVLQQPNMELISPYFSTIP